MPKVQILILHKIINSMKKNNNNAKAVELDCQVKMGHSRSVNCLRFSPVTSFFLASGSDDGKIIVWTKRERIKNFGSSEKVKTWAENKVFFGHTKEVYELRWFRGEKNLISGGHDFSIIVWDVATARPVVPAS